MTTSSFLLPLDIDTDTKKIEKGLSEKASAKGIDFIGSIAIGLENVFYRVWVV